MAFFFELTDCEDHICCSTFSAETALTFWKQAGFRVQYETVEEDSGDKLAGDGQESDTSGIITGLAVPFSFINMHYICAFELL